MTVKNNALVTGATGIQGRVLLKKLVASADWGSIYAVSRHEDPDLKGTRVKHLPLNLLEEQKVKELVKQAKDVTHVFHLAFAGDTMNADKSTAIMLYNLVEALEAAGARLQHVYFTQGTKYYGVHLTTKSLKTPFKETDPRHIGHNFYYGLNPDLEDYVQKRRSEGTQWTWSTLRPGPIIGYSPTSFMNLLHTIAVYGTLCKALNVGAMRFPGTKAAYEAVVDVADNEVIADAQMWLATTPGVANQAYNISNGEVFRWSQVWPTIAAWFGLPAYESLRQPLPLLMMKHDDTWRSLCKKWGLKDHYPTLANWEFADGTLLFEDDVFSNVAKLTRAGFHGQVVDTEDMWVRKLEELVQRGIIPHPRTLGK